MYKNLFLIKKVSMIIGIIFCTGFLLAMEQNEQTIREEQNDEFSELIRSVPYAKKENQQKIQQQIIKLLTQGVDPNQTQTLHSEVFSLGAQFLPLSYLVSPTIVTSDTNRSFIQEIVKICIAHGADPGKDESNHSRIDGFLRRSAYAMIDEFSWTNNSKGKDIKSFMQKERKFYLREPNRKRCYLMLLAHTNDKDSLFAKLPIDIIKTIGKYLIKS